MKMNALFPHRLSVRITNSIHLYLKGKFNSQHMSVQVLGENTDRPVLLRNHR